MPCPKVSILVPVYNVSSYLAQCLDSLVNQTLKDIEIICVNDGSTDNSLEILQSYKSRYNNIIIVNKDNGGLPSARNAGLDVASGEYVGFVDSDDYVELTMFDKLYHTALAKSVDVVVCGGIPFPDNPAPSKWLIDVLSPRKITYPCCCRELLFDEPGSRPFLWRMLIRRSLIESNNIRLKEDIILGEDQGLQFKVFSKANGISLIPDHLYHYRWWRPGSIMQQDTSNIQKKVQSHIRLIEHLFDILTESQLLREVKKDYILYSIDLIYDDFIKLPLSYRIDAAKSLSNLFDLMNIWEYWFELPVEKKEMFEYVTFISNEGKNEVNLSIIITCNNSEPYIERCLDSVCENTPKTVEIICINNSCDEGTFLHLHKRLHDDSRILLINQEKKSDMECWIKGIKYASSNKIMFLNSSDYLIGLENDDIINTVFKCDTDYILFNYKSSNYFMKKGISLSNTSAFDIMNIGELPSINQCVFNRSVLVDTVMDLKDYSWFNDYVFMATFFKKNPSCHLLNALSYYYNPLWIPDRIACWQANFILDGCLELLDCGTQSGIDWLNDFVLDLLNNDYMIKLIVNASEMHVDPNDKDGLSSEVGTWCKIIDLNNRINKKNAKYSELMIIKPYLERRHLRLHNIQLSSVSM